MMTTSDKCDSVTLGSFHFAHTQLGGHDHIFLNLQLCRMYYLQTNQEKEKPYMPCQVVTSIREERPPKNLTGRSSADFVFAKRAENQYLGLLKKRGGIRTNFCVGNRKFLLSAQHPVVNVTVCKFLLFEEKNYKSKMFLLVFYTYLCMCTST